MSESERAYQVCMHASCRATYGMTESLVACRTCGGLLDVEYDWNRAKIPASLRDFEANGSCRTHPLDFSGVWRFRQLLPFAPEPSIVTIGEGQTLLQCADGPARYIGLEPGGAYLQYEGLNPSGSFKDNGMAAAFTHARMVGATRAACASTGNTSASLAMFCGVSGLMRAVIFIGSGKVAHGKLAQALDFGALTLQIEGDFDDAMARVLEVSNEMGIYLVNSVNPFRLEGQKGIIYRILESLAWQPPDWIVVPGGNLGNASSFGKALFELAHLGLIAHVPRLAVINASGADTLYQLYEREGVRWNRGHVDRTAIDNYFDQMTREGRKASTIASAIEINRPVNLMKCLRALEICDGVVRHVTDQEILDAKAQVGRGGMGCEPASAASIAGARKLRQEGIIGRGDRVVCVLTGHALKDPNLTVLYHMGDPEPFARILAPHGVTCAPFANRPIAVPNDTGAIADAISRQDRAGSPAANETNA